MMKMMLDDPRCPSGYIWIYPYKDRYGRYVSGHCRKMKKRRDKHGKV